GAHDAAQPARRRRVAVGGGGEPVLRRDRRSDRRRRAGRRPAEPQYRLTPSTRRTIKRVHRLLVQPVRWKGSSPVRCTVSRKRDLRVPFSFPDAYIARAADAPVAADVEGPALGGADRQRQAIAARAHRRAGATAPAYSLVMLVELLGRIVAFVDSHRRAGLRAHEGQSHAALVLSARRRARAYWIAREP